jgi:hypothetical protein
MWHASYHKLINTARIGPDLVPERPLLVELLLKLPAAGPAACCHVADGGAQRRILLLLRTSARAYRTDRQPMRSRGSWESGQGDSGGDAMQVVVQRI